MRVNGSIDMAEGTVVKNLTVDQGDTFPEMPNAGELFHHNTLGLCVYTKGDWLSLAEVGVVAVDGTVRQLVVSMQDGVATLSLATDLILPGSGAVRLPSGTTAQRPAGAGNGDTRYNSDTHTLEGFMNGSWETLASGDSVAAALQVRRTTTRSLSTTQTEVTFNVVDYSTSSGLELGTNTARLVANTAGLYAVSFEGECINTNNANIDYFQMRLNDAPIANGLITINSRSTRMRVSKTLLLYLASGDYITVAGYSSSGTSGTLQLGATLSAFSLTSVQGPPGPAGGMSTTFLSASQFDNPIVAGWAVNAVAPIVADPTNQALATRAFDDSVEEGVGFTVYVPPSATTLYLNVVGKAATAPSGSVAAVLRAYGRTIATEAAVGSWSTAQQAPTFPIAANTLYREHAIQFSLSSLGLTAGKVGQVELTRHASSAGDTLIGDFLMLSALITFA